MSEPTMVSVTSLQTVRVECVGEARAVTATGSQWVEFRDECNRFRALLDEATERVPAWAGSNDEAYAWWVRAMTALGKQP